MTDTSNTEDLFKAYFILNDYCNSIYFHPNVDKNKIDYFRRELNLFVDLVEDVVPEK